MDENNPVPANPAGQSTARKLATGAALIALPVVAGMLYVKTKGATESRDRALEKGTQYDLAALQQVDPALIKWHQASRIDVQMPSARAIAIDPSGNYLVGGDNLIRRVGPDAQPLANIAVKGAVQALTTDAAGNIYVALKDHVEVFTAEGARKSVFPPLAADAYLTSIALSNGNLYIGDFASRLIYRTDLEGKVLNTIGKPDPGKNVPGLLLPSPHMDVAVAADGTIWAANTGRHRLENYTPDGNLERFWGKPGAEIDAFAGCCNPADFWLLADGSFVTAEKGVARVKRYLPDGRFTEVVAAAGSFPANMIGLDVTADSQGRIVVLSRGAGIVQTFAPDGAPQ